MFAIVAGFDSTVIVKSTLESFLPAPPSLTIATDSKSFFDCLIKLGITKEKRLIIDIIALHKAYEQRIIIEVV